MNEDKKCIKWGILGTGNIANTFATALKGLKEAKIVAVAARDGKKAKEFAQKYQITKSYEGYEQLVCDPEIDIVYIATIHTMHYEHMKLCLEHGKSVLCEKPFTLNQKQANEICELAKKKNVFVMEAMWTKFLPITNQVKEWIKAGKIGDVKQIRVDFGFANEFDEASRLYNKKMAGGALLDVGIYPLTYACHLMGQMPIKIESSVSYAPSGVDEVNSMLLTFENNVIAVLGSAISANLGSEAVITGTKGKIRVPYFYGAQDAFLLNNQEETIEHAHIPHLVNGYEYEALAVMKNLNIKSTENEIHSTKDTLKILEIMDDLRYNWNITYPNE